MENEDSQKEIFLAARPKEESTGTISKKEPGVPTLRGYLVEEEREVPLSKHEEVHGIPYSVKYFGIPEQAFRGLNELTDIFNIREKLAAIDSYVNETIAKEGLQDNIAAFNEIMEEIAEAIHLRKSETPLSKLEKIFSYIALRSGIKTRPAKIKRSSIAEEIDQMRQKTLAQYKKTHPKTFRRLEGFLGMIK